MKLPSILKPNKSQVSALKSYLRVIASAGVGLLIHKFGADPQVSLLIGAATAPVLKWIDPTEKSLGIGSANVTTPSA